MINGTNGTSIAELRKAAIKYFQFSTPQGLSSNFIKMRNCGLQQRIRIVF